MTDKFSDIITAAVEKQLTRNAAVQDAAVRHAVTLGVGTAIINTHGANIRAFPTGNVPDGQIYQFPTEEAYENYLHRKHSSLSPEGEALEETDKEVEELRRRIDTIITAWENEGPVPEHHQRMQQFLRANWPTLALAIEKLCVLDSLDEANNETTIPKEHQ